MTKKSLFVKSFLFKYFNTLSSFAIGLIYTFVIANFLGPENYGLVTYFISFVSGLVGITGINFLIGFISSYYPKIRSKKLFVYVLIAQLIISSIVLLILFGFGAQILNVLGKDNLPLFLACSFFIILVPLQSLLEYLLQAFKFFGKTMKNGILFNCLNLILAIFFVLFLYLGVFGVVYARLISLIVAIVLLFIIIKKLKFESKKIDLKDIKKYFIFAIPTSLLRGVNGQLFIVLLGMFIGNATLGIYYLAERLASVFISAPISSLSEVLMPFSVEKSHEPQVIANYASMTCRFSLILSAFFSVFLILIGKPFIDLLFPKYSAGFVLLPLFALYFILNSFTLLQSILISLNRFDLMIKATLVSLVVTAISGFILLPWLSAEGAIITLIIAEVAYVIALVFLLRSYKLSLSLIPKKQDFLVLFQFFLKVKSKLNNK